MNGIKALLFDVDGTLLDSLEANTKHFQNVFKAAGYPPPTLAEYASVFHFTLRTAFNILQKHRSKRQIGS